MTNGASADRFHPQYGELHGELLARPFPVVPGQVMVSHRAVIFTPAEVGAHRAAVAALAEMPGVVATREEQGFQVLRLDSVELRIERHTEFTTFTVFATQAGVPFADSAIDRLPDGWLDTIPGRILAAVEIASELVAPADAGTSATMERVSEYFGQERLVGGWVVDRMASVWSHFRPDERGATRFLVQIHRLTSGRYGRLLQRLVEIENYRMGAMLSLPLARELLPQVEDLEARRFNLVERIGAMDDGDGRVLLANLTDLSLAAERLRARCSSRFGLTESYVRILSSRIRELHEEQVPGYQTLGELFDRRLVEAWHTCERAQAGLDALSERVQSITALLRTRVEVNLQGQNELMLAGVDQRAAAQMKLQRNVEGLVVVVLTFYLASLLMLLLEGTKAFGVRVNPALVVTLLVPFLGYGVWRGVRHVQRRSRSAD